MLVPAVTRGKAPPTPKAGVKEEVGEVDVGLLKEMV